ncbi:MAG: hypothetical protein FJ279_29895, partial [Planctomycetes bacterium]|nr:hypothetical protein [Planctomycetota bacterium]
MRPIERLGVGRLFIAAASLLLAAGATITFAQPRQSAKALPPSAEAHLAEIAKSYPNLTSALRRCLESSDPQNLKALRRVSEFMNSETPDVRLALRIMDSARPRATPPAPPITLDGRAPDWAAVPSAQLPPETQAQTHSARLEDIRAVVLPSSRPNTEHRTPNTTFCLFVTFKPKDLSFLQQPGSCFCLDLDLVGTPGSDVRLWLSGILQPAEVDPRPSASVSQSKIQNLKSKIQIQAWPIETKNPMTPFPDAQVAIAEVVEIALPLAALAQHPVIGPQGDFKPHFTLHAHTRFTDEGTKKQVRSYSRPFFISYDGAPADYYARPYAETLLALAADIDLKPDDSLALAVAIEDAFFRFLVADDVKPHLRAETAATLRQALELDAWQRSLGMTETLASLPFEAKLAWAWRGACSPTTRFFSMHSTGQRQKDQYDWFATKPETLERMRQLAIRENLAAPTVEKTARNVERFVQSKTKYRQELETMRKRVEEGSMKEALYLQAKEEADKGLDFFCMFRDKKVFCRYIESANKHLELFEQRGNFYGSCGQETIICTAFLRSVGIAPFRFYRDLSRQTGATTDHAWPGYYDPAAQKWRSLQRFKSSDKFIYYAW